MISHAIAKRGDHGEEEGIGTLMASQAVDAIFSIKDVAANIAFDHVIKFISSGINVITSGQHQHHTPLLWRKFVGNSGLNHAQFVVDYPIIIDVKP